MPRWRDTKQGKIKPEVKVLPKNAIQSAPLSFRIKSFIIDMFMIMMPLMYFTTYVVMDGKDDFQGSSDARWISALVYALIIILFWFFKGQTPGFKAYDLRLIDNKTGENVSFLKSLFRYIIFIISASTIVLSFVPFFRKDKKTLQDLLSNSSVIVKK